MSMEMNKDGSLHSIKLLDYLLTFLFSNKVKLDGKGASFLMSSVHYHLFQKEPVCTWNVLVFLSSPQLP